jgi:hypothetical protein
MLCSSCTQYIWRRKHPEEYRARNKRAYDKQQLNGARYRRHGITEEIFLALLEAQEGKCAVCRAEEPGGKWGVWHIDHDHTCCPGVYGCELCVRGLLCMLCNQMLGQAKDSPDTLRAAIVYLEAGCVRLPTTSRAWP